MEDSAKVAGDVGWSDLPCSSGAAMSVVRWAGPESPPSLRTSSRRAMEPAFEPASRSIFAYSSSTRDSASSRFKRAMSRRFFRSAVEITEISLPELAWRWAGERTSRGAVARAARAGETGTVAALARVSFTFLRSFSCANTLPEVVLFCIDASVCSDVGALKPVGTCVIASSRVDL